MTEITQATEIKIRDSGLERRLFQGSSGTIYEATPHGWQPLAHWGGMLVEWIDDRGFEIVEVVG